MQARLCAILGRNKDIAVQPARLEHFVLSDGELVDPAFVIADRNWTLHGLNHDTGQALFVELPAGTDLGVSTFCYTTQHDLALRVLLVPYADLIALADTMPPPPNPVFVFNIGRCGSTLLSKIFAEVPGVWSLSEPDALSNLTQDRHRTPFDTRVALVRAAVRFLFRPPEGREGDTFVVKFRSYTIFDMEPYFAAFPDARHLFLWREPAGWTNSFYMIGQLIRASFDMPEHDSLDFRWDMLTARAPREIYARYDDLAGEGRDEEALLAALWAVSMEAYLAAKAKGAPLEPFSYRQLNTMRELTVPRLLAASGLSQTHIARAMQAYENDSQEDSVLAGVKKMVPLSETQHARIATLLAGHPAHALDEDRPITA